MANIICDGEIRIYVQPPHNLHAGDNSMPPLRHGRTLAWVVAASGAAFKTPLTGLVSRVEVAWGGSRFGCAEIDAWIPRDWSVSQITQAVREVADVAYRDVGSSLEREEAEFAQLPERMRLPRVIAKWVSLGLNERASAGGAG